jgi:peptidoglycan/xylan/chitin deacetylase (PgdA/CDA1 family)
MKIKKIIYSTLLFLGKVFFNNRRSKVLYYHDVHTDGDPPNTNMSTPLELFEKHIQIIKKEGFEIVHKITEPENQVMLAFDDGFKGIFTNRFYFIKENIRPTIFLITEKIGKNDFLQEQEIKELQESGFIFQSHTHTHPDLNELTEHALQIELQLSKDILKNKYAIQTILFHI